MSMLRPYAVHVLVDDDDAPALEPANVSRRRDDYERLLERGRQARRSPTRAGITDHSAGHPATDDAQEAHQPAYAHDTPHAPAPPEAELESRPIGETAAHTRGGTQAETAPASAQESVETLAQQLQRHETPYLDVLANEQQQLLMLVDYLANRVADFCTDPAVLAQGHWEIRLALDPKILPGCTLAMTLSYFDLTLRFEAEQIRSKQLVLHHGDVLKQRLEVLLAQHNVPRTVEIVVL
ncbi:type III secretion system protein SctP [Trinickia fusca]|uniref:Type III secretion protein HpaP n=1 Tax=Trinickia fusca TaxID=2419777 RepID=A0A494X1G8_9BURK|nr:type III secretion system protein SctP [Trinickia fusca]RKP44567.1 hypothetical protein D7S89_22065 [Trinickia fusca]